MKVVRTDVFSEPMFDPGTIVLIKPFVGLACGEAACTAGSLAVQAVRIISNSFSR